MSLRRVETGPGFAPNPESFAFSPIVSQCCLFHLDHSLLTKAKAPVSANVVQKQQSLDAVKEKSQRGTFWQHCTSVILRRGVTECLKRPQSRLPFSERYYSPQANVTHKNTYSCIRQHQWKGRHHGGREKTEPEGERVERGWGCFHDSRCHLAAAALKPQRLFSRETLQSTCCNYALLLCCNRVNRIMCLTAWHTHTHTKAFSVISFLRTQACEQRNAASCPAQVHHGPAPAVTLWLDMCNST